MFPFTQLCVLLSVLFSIIQVNGHGYMLEPPGRSSMWRVGYNTLVNYDDNGLNCGGASVQWNQNRGMCGICGDAYHEPTPRENENGGKYGLGIISETYYKENGYIPFTIRITAPHKGYFTFSICNLDTMYETEECFQQLYLSDGSKKIGGIKTASNYTGYLVIPHNLQCDHCVLRWHYRAGNNVNQCRNGRMSSHCGPQETFRNCADVSIL